MVWGFGSTTTYDNYVAEYIAKNYINSIKKKLRTVKNTNTVTTQNEKTKLTIFEFVKNEDIRIEETTNGQTYKFSGSYFAYAVWKNKLSVVKLFLKSATPDKKIELMQTGISVCDKEDYLEGYTSFQVAVRKGYLQIVTLFLKSVTLTEKFKLLSEPDAEGQNSICIALLNSPKMLDNILKVVMQLFKKNTDNINYIINYPNDIGETPLVVIDKEINKRHIKEEAKWSRAKQKEKIKLIDNYYKIKEQYDRLKVKISGMGAKSMSYDSLVGVLEKKEFGGQMETFKTFDPIIKKRISAPEEKIKSLIGQSVFILSTPNPLGYNFLLLNNLELLLKYGATLNEDEKKNNGTLQNNLNEIRNIYLRVNFNAKTGDETDLKITEIQKQIQGMMTNNTKTPSPPKKKGEWSNVCIKF